MDKKSGWRAKIGVDPFTGKGRVRLLKLAIWAAGLSMAGRLAAWTYLGRSGANPVEWLQNQTGWQGVAWLLATLLCTPASKIPKMGWVVGARRVLGLWAFAFASLHLGVYALDSGLDLAEIARDVVKRPFVTAGMAAWLAMLPLAATSNRKAMLALGTGWRKLHRLAYASAALGLLHWYWMREPKGRLEEWSVFAGWFAAWAAIRIAIAWQKKRARRT